MKREKNSKGQGLLEFVLILPVLIIVAFGVLDLGRAFHAVVVITNASRVGARYLATHPLDKVPDDLGNTFVGTKQAAVDEAANSFINLELSDVSVQGCIDNDPPPSCDSGHPIVVTVNYKFDLITGWFFPNPIDLTRQTTMMVP